MSWEFELVDGPYGSATNGIAWDGEGLLFTQVGESRILRYNPQGGDTAEFRRWTSRTTDLAFSASGVLYGCQSGSRRIVRFNLDGSTNQLADRVDGRYHNHPYSLAADSRGRIWFSDPYSSIPARGPQIYGPLDHASVLRQEHPTPTSQDWLVRRMTHDTTDPGAILVSQDESTLYLAENGDASGGQRELRAYPILDDGTLGTYLVLHTFGSDHRGVHRGIGGMCLDAGGNLLACAGWQRSGPGPTVYVFSPEGRILESHPVPADQPTNCAFGDPDLRTLYVTTEAGHLYRVRDTGRQGWVLHPQARQS